MLLILPHDFEPGDEYDPWSSCCLVLWERTGPPPPPPTLPPSRRPTFTRPGPRWQLRTWLDTDMQEHLP